MTSDHISLMTDIHQQAIKPGSSSAWGPWFLPIRCQLREHVCLLRNTQVCTHCRCPAQGHPSVSAVAAEAAVSRESPRGELTTPVSVCLPGRRPSAGCGYPTGTGIWPLDCTVDFYNCSKTGGGGLHITIVGYYRRLRDPAP